MKFSLILLLALSQPILLMAQGRENIRAILQAQNLKGSPTGDLRHFEYQGSIFLDENWTDAIVKMQNGKMFKDISVKYNVQDDILYFLGEDDMTMKFTSPVKEFSLIEKPGLVRVFRAGFPKVGDYNEESFYEVLVEGNYTLLKKITKKIVESREYGSAVINKTVVSNTRTFLSHEGKLTEIKRDKSSIGAVTGKMDGLNQFIKTKKIDLKKDEDLVSVINYVNSL